MKKNLSIWDILTAILVLGILCLGCGFVNIFMNPSWPLNPFKPEATITIASLIDPDAPGSIEQVGAFGATAKTVTAEPKTIARPTRTLRPTSTLAPSATPYVAPTGTALPTATETPAPTSANARCFVVSEMPVDNTEFEGGKEFTKSWTLRNNSGATWDASGADVRFTGGASLQVEKDVYDLEASVPYKGMITITIRMKAPLSSGTYTSNWALMDGSTNLCAFFAKIVVK